MRVVRTCEICGNDYIATNGKSKYCSDQCKKVAYKTRQKRFKENNPQYMQDWNKRNKDYQKQYVEKNKTHIAKLKRKYRNELIEAKICVCEICGKTFETYVKRKVTCSKECSDIRKKIKGRQKENSTQEKS